MIYWFFLKTWRKALISETYKKARKWKRTSKVFDTIQLACIHDPHADIQSTELENNKMVMSELYAIKINQFHILPSELFRWVVCRNKWENVERVGMWEIVEIAGWRFITFHNERKMCDEAFATSKFHDISLSCWKLVNRNTQTKIVMMFFLFSRFFKLKTQRCIKTDEKYERYKTIVLTAFNKLKDFFKIKDSNFINMFF